MIAGRQQGRAQEPEAAQAAPGLPAHLPVATPEGWCPAGRLAPGRRVFCLDAAPQPVIAAAMVHRPAGWLVRLPRAALGNPAALLLPPGQPVALDLDAAADRYGDPVALVPAVALVGWRGVTRQRVPQVRLVTLTFARSQVIYAGPGLLLGCPGAARPLRPEGPPAPPLSTDEARHLMACVMAGEVGAALRRGPYAAFDTANRP